MPAIPTNLNFNYDQPDPTAGLMSDYHAHGAPPSPSLLDTADWFGTMKWAVDWAKNAYDKADPLNPGQMRQIGDDPGLGQSTVISAKDANERYGVKPDRYGNGVTFSQDLPEDVAKRMSDNYTQQSIQKATLQDAQNDGTLRSVARWGVDTAAMLLDPVNAASMYFAGGVAGEAAVARGLSALKMMTPATAEAVGEFGAAGIAGGLSRTAFRGAAGAAEGLAMQAPISAFKAATSEGVGREYTVNDAIHESVIGAAGFMSIMHMGGGAVMDKLTGRVAAAAKMMAERMSPEAKAEALQVAAGQMAEGKPVEITPLLDHDINRDMFGNALETDRSAWDESNYQQWLADHPSDTHTIEPTEHGGTIDPTSGGVASEEMYYQAWLEAHQQPGREQFAQRLGSLVPGSDEWHSAFRDATGKDIAESALEGGILDDATRKQRLTDAAQEAAKPIPSTEEAKIQARDTDMKESPPVDAVRSDAVNELDERAKELLDNEKYTPEVAEIENANRENQEVIKGLKQFMTCFLGGSNG